MNKKNLANAQLLNPVTTSATTITVKQSQGDSLPDVPFFATLSPLGMLSTIDNSEIIEVTARSDDTLTVVRGQRGTTAKEFQAESILANSVYAEDLEGMLSKDGGEMTGPLIIDGETTSPGGKYYATEVTIPYPGTMNLSGFGFRPREVEMFRAAQEGLNGRLSSRGVAVENASGIFQRAEYTRQISLSSTSGIENSIIALPAAAGSSFAVRASVGAFTHDGIILDVLDATPEHASWVLVARG